MSNFSKRISSFLGKFRKESSPEFNVLILGLNNAGKSTLAARLGLESVEAMESITPTTGVTEKHLKFKKIKVCLRDVGGQWRMRQSWQTYYQDANILIYVIDSKDVFRLAEARCELCDVLLDERTSQVPLLILANKQDAFGALPSSTITELLGLNRLEGRMWSILECSTLTGKGINTAINWIYHKLHVAPPSIFSKLLTPSLLFGTSCAIRRRQTGVN